MANSANLKRSSPTEARINGRKGGMASVKARQRKKSLKEAVLAVLEAVRENPETGTEENGFEAVAASLYLKAVGGDVSAINSLRDLIGEKPKDKAEVDATVKVIMDRSAEKYGK